MEVQRIYCAEQIVIPPTLGDIMKAYTKDVIRQTNENTSTKQLLEFSYQCDLVAARFRVAHLFQRPKLARGWAV